MNRFAITNSIFLFCVFILSFNDSAIASRSTSLNYNFQNADLIFHTSKSNQSYAIMWASQSLLSHVGLIERDSSGKYYVIEAIAKVSRTPLEQWIKRGRFKHYEIYRYKNLSETQKKLIIKNAKKYLGRKYDVSFTNHNQEIYCSELVAYAFNDSQVKIGEYQKVSSLNVDNAIVKSLVKKRWKNHPLCQNKKINFDQCWQNILSDELITPVSLTQDPHIEKIYTSYK